MSLVKYTCKSCGEERERPDWITPCFVDICCDCCLKKGLKPDRSNLACQDFELFRKGKELKPDEKKGVSLEKAISTTLENLGIPHIPNPFNLCYSRFQIENPDIIVEGLNAIIECKNLSEFSVSTLSEAWLRKHFVEVERVKRYWQPQKGSGIWVTKKWRKKRAT